MNRDNFNFSNAFQDAILACLIRHPEKFFACGSILQPSYFAGVYSTTVARAALRFYTEQSRFPTWEVLEQLSRDDIVRMEANEEEAQSKLTEYLNELKSIDTADVDYIVPRVAAFAKERAVIIAVKKSVDLIKEGKIGQDMVKMFEDALSIGQNLDDMGYILHAHAEEVIDKITQKGYGIKCGYPLLDQIWYNGWGPGWLVVPLAPPKRFKSTFSLNVALNVVGPAIGEDVFYYSCEISAELAAMRCMSSMCRLSPKHLYETPNKFKEAVKNSMPSLVAGNLLFKAFPAGTATIADIKAHAKQAIKQFKLNPKLIVIDYAETVKPSDTKNVADYRQQASIYTEARAMGSELGCTILMPERCNRESISSRVPNMTSMQGALQKSGIIDVGIGLCATEAEYYQNTLRFFTFIDRHAAAGKHFVGKVDPELFTISINEEIPYDPEEEDGNDKPRKRSKKPSDLPDELQ